MNRKYMVPYEEIGAEKLKELIHAFYRRVDVHPLLRPLFPGDLKETIRKQIQFQTQYLGGPNLSIKTWSSDDESKTYAL